MWLPHHQALQVGDGHDAASTAQVLHRGAQATDPLADEGCGTKGEVVLDLGGGATGAAAAGAAAAGQAAAQAPADDDSDGIYYRPLQPSDMEQCQVSGRAGGTSTFQTTRRQTQRVGTPLAHPVYK
jgi:hypothetical protein